jgi:hypothetical protein
MRTAYISGPITGYENHNARRFNLTAGHARNKGYSVVNPIELDKKIKPDDAWRWEDYLKRDLGEMCMHCNCIVLLPNWEKSRGAVLEVFVAWILQLDIILVDEAWIKTKSPEIPRPIGAMNIPFLTKLMSSMFKFFLIREAITQEPICSNP